MKDRSRKFTVSRYTNRNGDASVIITLPVEAAVRLTGRYDQLDTEFYREVFGEVDAELSRFDAGL